MQVLASTTLVPHGNDVMNFTGTFAKENKNVAKREINVALLAQTPGRWAVFEAEWHICVSNIVISDLGNGLSPGRHLTVIYTNAGMLLIWPFGINISDILVEINSFYSTKRISISRLQKLSISSRPQ